MKPQGIADQIRHGMALAFFASAYADQADEAGEPLRGQILDQLPERVDPAATHAAHTLAMDFIRANPLTAPASNDNVHLIALYLHAAGLPDDGADRTISPDLFGHYLAMQAMGHGVGLESFGYAVRDAFKVPYLEFGFHSLERDYFDGGDA